MSLFQTSIILVKWLLFVLLLLIAASYLFLTFAPTFGAGNAPASPKELASAQFSDGAFRNKLPPAPRPDGFVTDYLKEQFGGTQVRVPPAAIPVVRLEPVALQARPAPGMRAIWLGHSSVLIELDGSRLLVDPVFSKHASPFSFAGPARFHLPALSLLDLAGIDVVMISHDHYDHLDMATVRHLATTGARFLVPLGVGAHLRRWQVPEAQITEMDWGQTHSVGSLVITCTPARHYSGRGLFDSKRTLWSSWTMVGPEHRVFFSGDTGYSPHFQEIGRQFGPFDLTVMKIGAYGPGQAWTDVHMHVDKAIQAHVDLRGQQMLPVHWATFNMAFHPWDEPIELAVRDAKAAGVTLLTPKVGELVTAGVPFQSTPWWRDLNRGVEK